MSSAKLRQAAAVENVDHRTARRLDRSLFKPSPLANGSARPTT
ncbi:hypothetical protein GGE24_007719 [Bradyrhizobium centrosematis]|nr:hypothetical protein [Bradyrhizobium centrosematis]MCS3778341.1 hypothetical protein [Bradyrhizobium centrosematis]